MSFIDDDDAIVVVGFVHCPLAAINTLTFISSFKHALTHSNLNIYIRRSTTITTSNSSTSEFNVAVLDFANGIVTFFSLNDYAFYVNEQCVSNEIVWPHTNFDANR